MGCFFHRYKGSYGLLLKTVFVGFHFVGFLLRKKSLRAVEVFFLLVSERKGEFLVGELV